MTEFEIAKQFCIHGEIEKISPCGEGHINKTFLVKTTEESTEAIALAR
jgi:hypothetical protein